jgi:hypothetical protein
MSRAQRRELNQHLHRKHNQTSLASTPDMPLRNRLELHERLHIDEICDHTHEDYEQPTVYRDLVKDA